MFKLIAAFSVLLAIASATPKAEPKPALLAYAAPASWPAPGLAWSAPAPWMAATATWGAPATRAWIAPAPAPLLWRAPAPSTLLWKAPMPAAWPLAATYSALPAPLPAPLLAAPATWLKK